MRIFGSVDRLDAVAVEGWATCPDYPAEKLSLELVLNGTVIARGAADIYRADLHSAQLGDGTCAFSIPTPTFLPATHLERLQVRVQGSPLVFDRPRPRLPGFDSVEKFERFGGLWIDEPDFMDQLGSRHRHGQLTDTMCEQLVRFVRDGYLILKGAVSAEVVEAVNADIDHVWRSPPEGIRVETFEPDGEMRRVLPQKSLRNGRTKLLDLHVHSSAARAAIANDASVAFLAAIFDTQPKAFGGIRDFVGEAYHER